MNPVIKMKVFLNDGKLEEYSAISFSNEGGYYFIKDEDGKMHLIPTDKVKDISGRIEC